MIGSKRLGQALRGAVLVSVAAPAFAQNVESYAEYEQFFTGTLIEGDYRSTFTNDGVFESIQEAESGGKPSNRTSEAEHLWRFTLPPGLAHTFHFQAELTDSGEGDDLELWWSDDDHDYWPLLVCTPADSGSVMSVTLPPELSGMLLIWMQDSDRSPGRNALDVFSIDWMCVETVPDGGSPPVPVAPTDAKAAGKSDRTVLVGWAHSGFGEDGFRIERSPAGMNAWFEAGTVAADTTEFVDSGLWPSTSYDYRVIACNAEGDSDPSGVVTAVTRALGSFASEAIVEIEGSTHLDHDVDSAGRVGVAMIAVISDGTPTGAGSLWFHERDPVSGGWSRQWLTDDRWQTVSFEYGPDDVPRMSYRDLGGDVQFAERIGGVWHDTVIGDGLAIRTSLAHDPAGRPAIAYGTRDYRGSRSGLWLVRRNGPGETWSLPERIDDAGWLTNAPTLRWTAEGQPAIAYFVSNTIDKQTVHELRYAEWNGSSWSVEVVHSGDLAYPSMSIDPNSGEPTIAYALQAQRGSDLWMLRRTAAGWVPELAATEVGTSPLDPPALLHDPLGRELISYLRVDYDAQALIGTVLATFTPGASAEEVVDPLGYGGGAASLAFDPRGEATVCHAGRLFDSGGSDDLWLTLSWR